MAMQTPSGNASTYLRSVLSSITAYPFSMFCRAQTESSTQAQPSLYFGAISADDDAHTLYFRGDLAGDPIGFRCTGPSFAGANVASVASYSVNTWTDMCGVAAATADRRLYANNAKTTSTASVGFAGGDIGIGAFFTTGSVTEFLSGRVASCAIWDAALTDEEVNSMYAGFSPRRIRPQSLKFYAPLVRQLLMDVVGAASFAGSVGSAAVADHPRSYGL